MNVSLPTSMRAFVRARMEKEGFANTSEYVRHLIRLEQTRHDRRLDALLAQGLDSGTPIEATPKMWRDLRRRVRSRSAKPTRRAAG